jgi:hypothetical protein
MRSAAEEAMLADMPSDLPEIKVETIDGFIGCYGSILGRKADALFDPLHVPGRDKLPKALKRQKKPYQLYAPQAHTVWAVVQMLEQTGGGFLVGEMGTGKTPMGATAVWLHAAYKLKRKGFRCLIMCPDHLVRKWKREIEHFVPNAKVRILTKWTEAIPYIESCKEDRPFSVVHSKGNRWKRPDGPEYIIVGADRIKLNATSVGMNDLENIRYSTRIVPTERVPVTDENGRSIPDGKGGWKMRTVVQRYISCPKCGQVPLSDKGTPLVAKDYDKKKIICDTHIAREVVQDGCKHSGRDILYTQKGGHLYASHSPISRWSSDRFPVGRKVVTKDKDGKNNVTYKIEECKEPLYSYTGKMNRWPMATIFQKRAKKLFDYAIIDESHEHKSDTSGRAVASSRMMSCAERVLCMTGTLIGGYADHMFPIMMRLGVKTLYDEGFRWGDTREFMERYGRIDKIINRTEKTGDNEHKRTSIKRGKGVTESTQTKNAPGIMPGLFSDHLLGCSVFLSLEKMSDQLPGFEEIPVGVEMDEDLALNYEYCEIMLRSAMRSSFKAAAKLASAMLHTLIDYPDMPYGWDRFIEDKAAVGYWDEPNNRSDDNWVGVLDPPAIEMKNPDGTDRILPKEQALIDLCLEEKAKGNQSWVFVQMTGVRDIQPRLKKVLEAAGLKVHILRSGDVDRQEREEWIMEIGSKYDVMISYPSLVGTGMDLFAKAADMNENENDETKYLHNFNTLIFYETGFNLFNILQASRRSWRLGQDKDCKVYYLYYRDTMQHRQMHLMSKKTVASHAIEGNFTSEGISAMAGNDSLQMEMAKSFDSVLDDSEAMKDNWKKMSPKARELSPEDLAEQEAQYGDFDPFDVWWDQEEEASVRFDEEVIKDLLGMDEEEAKAWNEENDRVIAALSAMKDAGIGEPKPPAQPSATPAITVSATVGEIPPVLMRPALEVLDNPEDIGPRLVVESVMDETTIKDENAQFAADPTHGQSTEPSEAEVIEAFTKMFESLIRK